MKLDATYKDRSGGHQGLDIIFHVDYADRIDPQIASKLKISLHADSEVQFLEGSEIGWSSLNPVGKRSTRLHHEFAVSGLKSDGFLVVTVDYGSANLITQSIAPRLRP